MVQLRFYFPVLLACLTACAHVEKTTTNGELKNYWGAASDSKFIRTRGIGSALDDAKGTTKRRGLARNAALTAARYEMLALIKGLKMEGGLTVGDLMQQDSTIQEKANRIISGAEEVQTEWTADDGAVVTIQIKRNDVDKLIERDKPYEPQPEYASNARPEVQTLSQAQSPSRKSPVLAGVAGLLVPGGGLIYAGKGHRAEGVVTFLLTGGLLAVGLSGSSKQDCNSGHDQGQSCNDATQGLALLGGLGLWAWMDWAGVNAVKEDNLKVSVVPTQGGARVELAHRF